MSQEDREFSRLVMTACFVGILAIIGAALMCRYAAWLVAWGQTNF